MISKLSNSSLLSKAYYKNMLVGNEAAFFSDFEHISTVYGDGTSVQIDFSSIPSTYKHLQLRFISTVTNNTECFIRFNSDTGANYYSHYLKGNGTSATSGSSSFSAAYVATISSGSGGYNVAGTVDILDYTSTTKKKTVRSLSGVANTTKEIGLYSAVWLGTSVISTISFRQGGFAFPATSRFSLYGIKG